MSAPLHDYKNYALLLKSFLCKKYGYCTICPAWHTKKKECCLLKISKTLRGKKKTTTIMSDKNGWKPEEEDEQKV